MPLTGEQLAKIAPACPTPVTTARLLWAAMLPAGIVLVTRAAAFVAQLAHESGEFRYSLEAASGLPYEGRKDLGNIQPGDGEKFKGRGIIQLTGRDNYEKYGRMIGVDLIASPSAAALPENAAKIAVAYWNDHHLNELADQGDFKGVTKAINGGYNGLEARTRYYHRALEILGAGASLA